MARVFSTAASFTSPRATSLTIVRRRKSLSQTGMHWACPFKLPASSLRILKINSCEQFCVSSPMKALYEIRMCP